VKKKPNGGMAESGVQAAPKAEGQRVAKRAEEPV
jgi:hypothetical protein